MSPSYHSSIFPGCHSVQGNGNVSLCKYPAEDIVRKWWIVFINMINKSAVESSKSASSAESTLPQQVQQLMLLSEAGPTVSVPG